MRAIQVKQAGGPEQLILQEVPAPDYGVEDVLVQIKAAGINYIDIYLRTGLYPPAHYPYTPGKEGSGIVVAVGKNVNEIKEGDRVAFCGTSTGSYAEFVALPADQIVVIPDSISFEMAAAVMLQGLTAYYLSHLTFPIKKDDEVLIHAGAGGVGLLLIQMAKLRGAKIITTVSTEDKAALAKKAGANDIAIYTQESFLEKVKQVTKNLGVHVVYDAVGKTTFDDSLKSLRVRGMLVSYGQASGPVPPFNVAKLAEKSLYITRPMLIHYTQTKAELRTMAADLFSLIGSGKLNITIGQHYSLTEAAKAHRDLEERKTIGKSIILVDPNRMS